VHHRKKSSVRKFFIIFISVGHFWVVELTYRKFFPSGSLYVVSSLILFPLFATGVGDTGGKFAASVVDTDGK
jgi:hypothetical protein